MRVLITLISILMSGIVVYAHDHNKAFFTIEKDQEITVEAEFPWTLRDAVKKHKPDLLDATTRSQYHLALKSYVRNHFRIYNERGNVLPIVMIREKREESHPHSSKYLITYKADKIDRIQNSMMFETNDDQENHHVIIIDGESKKAVTTPTKHFFDVEDARGIPNAKKLWFLALIPVAGYILFKVTFKREA